MLVYSHSQGQRGRQESQDPPQVSRCTFAFHLCLRLPHHINVALWPLLTHFYIYNPWKYFWTNYAALDQITDVTSSDRAVRCVFRQSVRTRQPSVRWLGRSQCLPFMFNFGCHVPGMDGCCEGQSTTFNSFINQASVRGMNYWLSEFRGNSLFLFPPWWTCFAVVCSASRSAQHYGMSLFRHANGDKVTDT